MYLNILTVLLAFLAYTLITYQKYVNNPKNYILTKYNTYMGDNYDKILSLTLSNNELKKDILDNIKSLTFLSSYYEFDIYFRNMSQLYYENEIHQYLKHPNITQKRIQYIGTDNMSDYSIFINEKNDRLDSYSEHFRNSYLTHIDMYSLNNFNKIINKFFLYDILKMNSYFFQELSKQIEYSDFNRIDKKTEFHYDNLIMNTLHKSNFSQLFYPENNDIYYTTTHNLNKLNQKYKCYHIVDTKCSLMSLTKDSKKIKIYNDNNYFWGSEAIMYRCCSM